MKYEKCIDCGKEKITKSQKNSPRCKRCNNILTNIKNNRIKRQYVQKNKHNKQKIKCEICNYESVNLISHLIFKHNLKAKDYKKIYGKEFKTIISESEKINYKKASKKCLDYWIDKGYSKEDAKTKVSEHQATFSRAKCIEKYGLEEGTKKFLERQNKWQNSLKNKSKEQICLINAKKSFDIKKYKQKYGDNWISKFLQTRCGEKEKKCYETFKTLDDLIDGIQKIIDNRTLLKQFIKKSKFIREIFGISQENEKEVINRCLSKFPKPISNRIFGNFYILEENVYKSYGEYQIALFLKENNIKFEYEKRYIPTEHFLYDFYLIDYNLYIEYTGLSDKRNIYSYDTRLDRKKELLSHNNLRCVFSNNIEIIKKRILDEKETHNKASLSTFTTIK